MATIAIFDFDRTITKIGSYTPFLLYMAIKRAPLRLLLCPLVPVAMLVYKAGLIHRRRLKEIMFGLLVGRAKSSELQPHIRDFLDYLKKNHLHDEAIKRINLHKDAGDTLVLATASFSLYIKPYAEELGFGHIIATELVEKEGEVLPQLDGENCYGEEKKRRTSELLQHLQANDNKTVFYTDDKSDIPLMAICDKGYAVNPDRTLARYAQSQDHVIIETWH